MVVGLEWKIWVRPGPWKEGPYYRSPETSRSHRVRDLGALAARRECESNIHLSIYVLWNISHL